MAITSVVLDPGGYESSYEYAAKGTTESLARALALVGQLTERCNALVELQERNAKVLDRYLMNERLTVPAVLAIYDKIKPMQELIREEFARHESEAAVGHRGCSWCRRARAVLDTLE